MILQITIPIEEYNRLQDSSVMLKQIAAILIQNKPDESPLQAVVEILDYNKTIHASLQEKEDELTAARIQLFNTVAALRDLHDAADNFVADQSGAPDQTCGLVQPITVAQGQQLINAQQHALEILTTVESEPLRN